MHLATSPKAALLTKDISVVDAVNLYLKKRSGCADADRAPYKDGYMLRNGSKSQESLLTWAAKKKFVKLESITASALDAWRDTWCFRANSPALRIYSSVVKAFFTWCVKFDHLERNPYDKLDRIRVIEIPTLPLTPEEFSKLLGKSPNETMTTVVLMMRWSGLAITDAACLRRDALGKDNRLRTYRKKTGEYVHVMLPAFVADMLRAHGNIHPDYFFWPKATRSRSSQAILIGNPLRKMYDAAGISPRGAHRLRDTFAVENLNSGMVIEDLAMLLGHSSTATTWRHYAPWVKSRQVKLDSAVERSLAVQLPAALENTNRLQ